jgi:hypothetical protein
LRLLFQLKTTSLRESEKNLSTHLCACLTRIARYIDRHPKRYRNARASMRHALQSVFGVQHDQDQKYARAGLIFIQLSRINAFGPGEFGVREEMFLKAATKGAAKHF